MAELGNRCSLYFICKSQTVVLSLQIFERNDIFEKLYLFALTILV